MRRYLPLLIAALLFIATGACAGDEAEGPDTSTPTQSPTTSLATATVTSEGTTTTTAAPLVDPDLEIDFVEFIEDSWTRSERRYGGEVPDVSWHGVVDLGRAVCEHLASDPTAVSSGASMESLAQVAALIADRLDLTYEPDALDAGFESRHDASLVTAFKHTGNRGVETGMLCPQVDAGPPDDPYVGRMFQSPWSINAIESDAADEAGQPDPVMIVGPYGAEGDTLVVELSTSVGKSSGEGFDVVYDQYADIDDLVDRISGDDPPDVIITPDWSLDDVADHLVDLVEMIDVGVLHETFGSWLIDAAKGHNGAVLGAPIKAALPKSLVWYQPAAFEEHGYEIPATFADLVTLSDQMVADGETPWCNYIRSGEEGGVTGWVGTDWVEGLLLGAEGSTVYDAWVDHEVLFADSRVETAFEHYVQMIDTPGYVYDRDNMLNEDLAANAAPLDDGDCLMHRQAEFFRSHLLMAGADPNDYTTFKFPAVDEQFGAAVIGGGAHYVAALNDDPAVEALVEFMVGDEFGQAALAASGEWMLPHPGFDQSLYPNELIRSWAGIVREGISADLYRIDGSDRMPPEVGNGSFWTGINELIAGTATVSEVLEDIDSSWPG